MRVQHLGISLLSLVLILAASNVPADPTAPSRPVYKNPLDITVDAKGETAEVVLTGPRTIAVVDLASGKIKEEKPWPAGKRMPEAGDVSVTGPSPTFQRRKLDLNWLTEFIRITFPDFANLRGITAPREDYIVIANQWAKSNLPATQLSQGWVFVNGVTAWGEGAWGASGYPLDEPKQGYADPSAVAVSPTSKVGFVASGGMDMILVIDERKGQRREVISEVHSHSYLFDLRTGRQLVSAKLPTQSNPRRLALSGDGKTLVVSNYLSDSLTVIDAVNLKVLRHISLNGPKPDAARRGEMLFNSAKLTFQGQFTCASCHPNGGADGLNWDLPRDGIGNPKNTKSLLGVKDTAPYGWLGSSSTLEDRIAGTLRSLHQYEPEENEVSDIAAYLRTLPAPEPPKPSAEELPKIARGRALFEGMARCAGCHSGPAYDDGRSHNVGTGVYPGEDRINTATLRGLSRTAPYLHDGRAKTMEEVFTKFNSKKQHGAADQLSAEELADLIAYLRSL